jgi:uncharacterized protein
MEKLLKITNDHPKAVLIVIFCITVFFLYFALQIEIDANTDSLIPEDIREEALGGEEFLVISAESEDPYTVGRIEKFAAAVEQIKTLPEIKTSTSPFNMITFQKAGHKLQVTPISPGHKVPGTVEEVNNFKTALTGDPIARGLVVSEDGKILNALFTLPYIEDPAGFLDRIYLIMATLEPDFTTYVTGTIPFAYATNRYLSGDFPKLLSLAALFILVVYFFSFRSKRSLLLPFSMVVIGTVWTLGLMRLLGHSISLVSVITPPIVLTIGSSYSIHVLNQYYRQARWEDPEDRKWIISSVLNVTSTIRMAALTTIVGFLSLLITRIGQVREFGIASSFGIGVCALLAFLYLPSALVLVRNPTRQQKEMVKRGLLAVYLGKLAGFLIKWRILLLGIMGSIAVGAVLLYPQIEMETNFMEYFPEKEQVIQDTRYIERRIGGYDTLNLTLTAPDNRKDYFLEPENLAGIAAFETRLKKSNLISYSYSFASYLSFLNKLMTGNEGIPEKRGLVLLLSRYLKTVMTLEDSDNMIRGLANEDFSEITVTFRYSVPKQGSYSFEQIMNSLIEEVEKDAAATIKTEIGREISGIGIKYQTLADMLRRDQRTSMILSIILVLILTTTAFKSLLYGLYAIIPLASGIMLTYILMAIFGIPMDMSTVMVSSIAIGVGVDNAIHFLLQYRKQLENPKVDGIPAALENTLSIAGRPIVLTTISIVGGFLLLMFSSFKPIQFFGFLISIALISTAIGTLFFLPALLSLQKDRNIHNADK